jgi:uncharacterized protein YigA (DUF484 family)
LSLPNPHGDGAISLAQRQQIAQRDKIRVLESKFTELILNAEENDATSEKVHRLTLGLLHAQDLNTLEQHLTDFLREQFDLPNSQLKLWSTQSTAANLTHPSLIVAEDALKNWTKDLSQPYCGQLPSVDIASWFVETPASIAIIPLRHNDTFGVLVIPSAQKSRFYPGMGTLFLNRIGELVSAALLRHLS